ncbi:MAG: hypothetical protein JRI80_10940 [Deltaproteobacteria bacterium]|nr:hypothetical protein [Deltaproteobacteria bacterium]
MKCPKCGYMSFDFNEICPKCQRNIISEREKMNHLPFKPEPPFLLAGLLAQTGDSQVGMELSEAAIVAGTQETMLPLEEPPALDIDMEEGSSMEIELEEIPPEEAPPESYAVPPEETPLSIEDLEFEKEESPVEEELVEVSTGTYASPLDEEALSLELEDLLDADKKSESVEENEPDEEAMTIEMDAVEPLETEPSPEPATQPEEEEPEEFFDSFDTEEAEPVEEEMHPDEEVTPEAPIAPSEPTPGEPDELFSPDDLKGYKIGQYNILTQSRSGKNREHTPSSADSGAKTSPGAKGVWDEITKDLEDLEFDIDDS